MKVKIKRCIAIVLTAFIALSLFTACGEEKITVIEEPASDLQPVSNTWLDEVSEKTRSIESAAVPEYDGGDTITAAADSAVDYVNPLYPNSTDEEEISELVSVKLLELDRQGQAVLSGVSGETREYNGTEYSYDGISDINIDGNVCDIELNEDIYFSDGVNLTADDVIFSMYVLADPAYDGPFDFAQLPIEGMSEYRGGMEQKWKLILSDLDSGTSSSPYYTDEERESFIKAFDEAGIEFTKEITAKSVETFAEDYSELALERTFADVSGNEGLQTAFAEYFCGYASGYDESDDGLWYDASGKTYNLLDICPTVGEFWELIKAKYGYDITDNGINYEKLGERDFGDMLTEKLCSDYPQLTEASGEEGAKTISGIEKTGMYSLCITFTSSPVELTEKLSIPVCPLHYYGSREMYKYTEGCFGFEKGSLTSIREQSVPLGAGAYTVSTFDGGEVLLERNPLYFRGCPYITFVRFKTGECDISGESGNVAVDSDSFVYIGINADRVSVGEDSSSDASNKLRRAFCVMFEAFRSEAAQSYGVSEITYPAAPSGAAAASVTDSGTALETAIQLLTEAGYEYSTDAGKFISAPEGASMEYVLRVCTDSASLSAARSAAAELSSVGITLDIVEHTSSETLKNLVSEGGADMWIMESCGGYKDVLHRLFRTDGEESKFGISCDELDKRIDDAACFKRLNVRSAYYREVLDDIMDKGVIVPMYAETDTIYFSENVDYNTIPGDMTVWYGWLSGLSKMKMA